MIEYIMQDMDAKFTVDEKKKKTPSRSYLMNNPERMMIVVNQSRVVCHKLYSRKKYKIILGVLCASKGSWELEKKIGRLFLTLLCGGEGH